MRVQIILNQASVWLAHVGIEHGERPIVVFHEHPVLGGFFELLLGNAA